MIQITSVRLALFTVLALGSAHLADAKNSGCQIRENTSATTSRGSVPSELASSDWSSIRAAYEAGRHAAVPVGGGFQFRNPGQQWKTQIDGRGFVTKPDGNTWSWGLELQSYGIGADQKTVGSKAHISAEGQSVSYQWDSNLTEWYKNDTRGLEHGFTVKSRPANSDGLLTLTIGVKGDLQPRVLPSGRDVAFMNKDGVSVLNYSNLTVFDARGKTLPAHFESSARELCISVNDALAQYPITIDPIAQQAYVKASNTQADDQFGGAVAVSGNTVVVGARFEDSNATGVNGNQSDNSVTTAGAAYVFVRNGGTWSQQAYLKASNTLGAAWFGTSVAISGDTIVVGALNESSNGTGVNGNQAGVGAPQSGAAYVFVRNGTTWSQQAYLKASNTGQSDRFGTAVGVSGDTIAVGALEEDSGATGVNGNEGDDVNNANSGAVYVFVRSGTTWSQQAYLKASNTGAGDSFGSKLAVSGDFIVVGANREDSLDNGTTVSPFSNVATDSGAAYIFARTGTTWIQEAHLKAGTTDGANLDEFGFAVAVSGDTVAVGAWGDDSTAVGVNGNPNTIGTTNSGSVRVYQRSGGIWILEAYLKSSNPEVGDIFGASVALSGNTLVVGAANSVLIGGEDSNATGVNGNQSDNSALSSGAAYVFVRAGSVWTQQAYLKASNTEATDYFGHAVAISGDLAVVGAPFEDSFQVGINGNQTNNSFSSAGAAYIFDLDNNPGTASYGTGTPGCTGTETLDVTHAPMINSPKFAITCSNAPPLSLGLGIVTDSQDLAGSDSLGVGVLIHSDLIFATELLTFDFFSDGTGYSETVGAIIPNNPVIVGSTYYASALWAWPLATCVLPGFNPFNLSTSQGLALTILAP